MEMNAVAAAKTTATITNAIVNILCKSIDVDMNFSRDHIMAATNGVSLQDEATMWQKIA